MRDTDDLSELTDALRTLPEQQRRAILLREWQGLTYKEIATEMQLSQAAVETLIFRARRSLAVAIERLRASSDMGSIFAAIKSILFGFGTKMAVTVVTVATTSVVAATPQARQNLVHFVDAVSNVAVPSAKPKHPHHAVAHSAPIATPAAPAATAKHAAKTIRSLARRRSCHSCPKANDEEVVCCAGGRRSRTGRCSGRTGRPDRETLPGPNIGPRENGRSPGCHPACRHDACANNDDADPNDNDARQDGERNR